MSKAEKFIEEQSLLPEQFPTDEEVITNKDALKSIEMAREEIKDKTIECFKYFVRNYCAKPNQWKIYEEEKHYIEVFIEMLNK